MGLADAGAGIEKQVEVRMVRKAVLGMILLGVAAILVAWAQRMYRNDVKGIRTAMAKRSPVRYGQQDLSGKTFAGAFLPYADFRQTKLHDADLSDANLQFADFGGADFHMASLSDANFAHANLREAKLRRARFLDTANFPYADFRNTQLSEVSFEGLFGKARRSQRKHLLDASIGGTNLTGALFDGAVCQYANFGRCLLVGASFKGSDCREANFAHADLRNADFTDADLRGAKWEGADLAGAIFTKAKRGAQ